MKKLFAGCIAAVSAFCMLKAPVHAAENLGDCYLNGSGHVSIFDPILVLTEYNYQVGDLGHYLDEAQLARADVNGDKLVNLDDSFCFLTYYNLAEVGGEWNQDAVPLTDAVKQYPDLFGANTPIK